MTSNDRCAPLVLVPKLAPAIWGGDALVRTYGKTGDPSTPLGESWECWDEDPVAAGAFAGHTLGALRSELGADLMGALDPAQRFPVLTKIIDAREALSVQVHPDDAYAQRVEHQPVGKTEGWYILAAAPGAELVLGWTRDTDRAEFECRVAEGTLGEILRRVRVQAGDAFFLPAGTLHAIGAGIQLFEAQQASDLTYRIFDWNRVGSDGRPRELHAAKAADVLDFRATFPDAVRPLAFADGDARHTVLLAGRRFTLERLDLAGPATLPAENRPPAITAMDAPLRLEAGGASTALRAWETAVVPACAGDVRIIPAGAAGAALVTRPEPDLQRLRSAAERAGVDPSASAAFFARFG